MHIGTDRTPAASEDGAVLITVGIALAVLLVLALHLQAPRPLKESGLGWVSERWLAEHRGGRSSSFL